ncbi:hypothetical protein Tco_1110127 [Tanacetum coccineum]|uniref:Uncharacterized protein n=1 Tax=Tanacetum coccineum TaxID=301880 RepID=A0ABQ5IKF6_9ASTR
MELEFDYRRLMISLLGYTVSFVTSDFPIHHLVKRWELEVQRKNNPHSRVVYWCFQSPLRLATRWQEDEPEPEEEREKILKMSKHDVHLISKGGWGYGGDGGDEVSRFSNEEVVFSWLDEVSLVDGVFNGAFGGVGDEELVVGEGVVRFSSSFVRSTKSCFGGMMVSLIFLKPWEEEA